MTTISNDRDAWTLFMHAALTRPSGVGTFQDDATAAAKLADAALCEYQRRFSTEAQSTPSGEVVKN